MSLSVPNTGATAVEANRYAVITQDRLETSWNWRPMVGSAVATMVWSRAARNIVSIRLRTMVRTSSGDNGTGGAREGASLTLITSPGRRDNSSAMSSGNVWVSAGSPCRSNLFISGVSDVVVQRRNAAKDSFYAVLSRQQSSSQAGTAAHGCIPPPGHAECVIGAVRWRVSPSDVRSGGLVSAAARGPAGGG